MIGLMGTILSVSPPPARFDLLIPMDRSLSVSLVRTKRLLVSSRVRCREKANINKLAVYRIIMFPQDLQLFVHVYFIEIKVNMYTK